jgi:hypothetical protein
VGEGVIGKEVGQFIGKLKNFKIERLAPPHFEIPKSFLILASANGL